MFEPMFEPVPEPMPERAEISFVLRGSPFDCGTQAWEKFLLPVVDSLQRQPKEQLAQFYNGLLLGAMASMSGDFGHSDAVQKLREIVELFAAAPLPDTPDTPSDSSVH